MTAQQGPRSTTTRRQLFSVAAVTAMAAAASEDSAHADEERAVSDDVPVYTNPLLAGVTENFADPTIIRGRDGCWYAYATNGPRFPGDERQLMMITRSSDLLDWEWVGPVFTSETMPTYDGKPADANRQFWAPEIAYVAGRYVLYYSYVVESPGEPWRVVAAATADHPAGPWTDTGEVVVGNETWEVRPGVTEIRNNIDPDLLTAPDGTRYLYYGSVQGGVRVVRLSHDGLRAEGDPVQLTDAHRYEAAYVLHRDGRYHLMLSVIGGCCAGAASAYPIMVGRAEDPMGPFVDRDGVPLAGPTGGGTPVLAPNGNRWVSTGHNAVATDLSGQDWIVSHAIDRAAPYVEGRENARHLVLTRLDWIDGWPVGNAGAGVPDGPEPGPRTAAALADAFEGDLAAWDVPEGWRIRSEAAGGYVHSTGDGSLVSHAVLTRDSRVRGAVRLEAGDGGRAGIVVGASGRKGVSTWIDRNRGQLVVESDMGRHRVHGSAPLPDSFDYDTWHEIQVEVNGGRFHAEVSESGQYDPVAELDTALPPGAAAGPVALSAEGTGADFDDVTAAPYRVLDARPVPLPEVGDLDPDLSTDFADGIGPGWSWTGDPAATTGEGGLRFVIPSATLIERRRPDGGDIPSLLLRDMPAGAWTAETTVTIPFGDTIPYGWPQAGLIAHGTDEDWAALAYTTRESRRFTAFARQVPPPDAGEAVYGHAALGPSRDTMHLRLHHTVAGNGEHRYRAALSLDGEVWQWHGTRTLPAGPQPRVGLFAMDHAESDDHPLSAAFDGFRVYR
ncbi:family 43 glycosylhydrolase [Brachybacterium sp. AOP43-C2-M15]|uniref:family 43 glycosylhydrolase n=1 Tax=Brachybacterium sp. AOP43-C2-M15 TaxID=3457661 RepID=UPI00403389C3